MKFRHLLFILILLTAGFAACKKNKKSPIPSISFLALTPDSIKSGSPDTTFLYFGFRDGDGDLGNDPTTGNYDVFLRDSRFRSDTNYQIARFLFPPIPDDARDPIEGVEGQGRLALRGLSILTRTDTLHLLHGDTLFYEMWVRDQAGNYSDTITTSLLRVLPK